MIVFLQISEFFPEKNDHDNIDNHENGKICVASIEILSDPVEILSHNSADCAATLS